MWQSADNPHRSHRHRVLMVAYEFPPVAAGGINRTVKFARYLPRFGWTPHILTPRNPDAAAWDESVLDQLPSQVRVHRTRSLERHVPRELMVWLAGVCGADRDRWRAALDWRLEKLYRPLGIPDQRIYWAAPSVLWGAGIVLRHRIDAIYSTSWPYSDHLAALLISKITGRPWIADLRDPWTQHMNYRPKCCRWDRRQRRAEQAVIRNASYVVTPTRSAGRAMRRLAASQPRDKFATIRNGFDPADFQHPDDPLPRFDIVHAGTFYKSRRPDALLSGLQRFLDRCPDARQSTRLRLFGMSLDQDLTGAARPECVELLPWVPHAQALRAYHQASVVLLIQHSESGVELTIPGKAYELMATGRHILGIAIKQRELRAMLRAYGRADFAEPTAESVAEALNRLYQAWKRGALAYGPPPRLVERFSRVEATRKLATLLNRITADRTNAGSRSSTAVPEPAVAT